MQLLVRNRNLKPKISKIQSDQWTNKKIIITNSIQNPSIRILLLIKTLILNQLKKKKPQVYLAWLDWLWGPWERLCKPATAQWNRSDLQSAASPRISPTSPSPSSSLNSRTQSATLILLILLLSSLSLGFRKLRNFVTEREKGENWKEKRERKEELVQRRWICEKRERGKWLLYVKL